MPVENINNNYKGYSITKKPSFKATIKYVDRKTFNRIMTQSLDSFEVGKISNSEWLMTEAAVKKASAFTREVCNCVVGTFFNPETKLTNMFHLSPYKKNMTNLMDVKKEIFRQVKILKGDSRSNLQGVLLGGNSTAIGTSWDVKLVETVKEAFAEISDKLGMDYSIIAERKSYSPCLNIFSDASKNTHYVNVQEPFVQIRKSVDLDHSYKTRIISPKDSIVIDSSLITSEVLEAIRREIGYEY